jgi:Calx-beta domain
VISVRAMSPAGTVGSAGAVLRVTPSGTAAAWADTTRSSRMPVVLAPTSADRTDAVGSVVVDLSQLAGPSTAAASLRLVEIGSDGSVLLPNVAYQWEPTSGTSGRLFFVAPGTTPSGATRRFHLYGGAGTGWTAPTFTDRVVLTQNVSSNSLNNAIRFETAGGRWIYDRSGGAMAGLYAANGDDWIGWSTAPRGNGFFRGIPNPVNPEGQLHPGRTDAQTTIVVDGPIRSSVVSTTTDGKWRGRWDVYPNYAIFTMEKIGHPYWIVYEGTPGGQVDTSDVVIRPNGLVNPIHEYWEGDIPGATSGEWVAAGDIADNRSLLMANLDDDTVFDSSWVFETMTVIGLGRRYSTPLATSVPHEYLVGLVDGVTSSAVEGRATALMNDRVAVHGAAETQPVVGAPVIVTQPIARTAAVGATVTFSVVATGSLPLSYQWFRDGVQIPAATNSSLVLTSVAATDNGADFSVAVSNSAGSTVSSAATLTVTTGPARFVISDVSIVEGNSGLTPLTFVISLTAPASGTTSVRYSTANGVAVAPSDFVAQSNVRVTFPPGTTSMPVTINIKGDGRREADERFRVVLSGAVGTTIQTASARVTIVNDD